MRMRWSLHCGREHWPVLPVDVFEEEPVTGHPLFSLPNAVVTPHLGASTAEAQAKVSLQIAQDLCDFLLEGAIAHSVNVPSLNAKEAQLLKALDGGSANPWRVRGPGYGEFHSPA